MDLMYIRTANGVHDSGYLRYFEADFDVTSDIEAVTNDFVLKMALSKTADDLLYVENQTDCMIFVEGTEYGGIISGVEIDIEADTITYSGRTWRGLLDQYVIEPPAGQDYRIVSGNLAVSLRSLPLHPLMDIADTTYTGGTFQFDRYITVFEGATKLLAAADSSLRLELSFEQTEQEYTGRATASIVEARNLSDLVDVSQDYSDKVNLRIVRDGTTPKHLICLGQGELKDREVIHLYADDEWNISQTPVAGAYPVETYDFSSSENLLADGMNHYAELIENHEQLEVTIHDLDVRLGDIVSAKDIYTGETVEAEITKIIYHCNDFGEHQTESYEYASKIRKRAKKKVVEMAAITTNEIDVILSS